MKLNLRRCLCLPLALLALATLLVACAGGPPFTAVEAPREGHGVLYIYREHGVFGLAMQPDLFVDGKPVGALPAGGYLRVELPLPLGPRQVAVGGLRCIPLPGGAVGPSTVTLAPGGTAFVELDIQTGSRAMGDRYVWNNTCRLNHAAPDKALHALKGLKRAN